MRHRIVDTHTHTCGRRAGRSGQTPLAPPCAPHRQQLAGGVRSRAEAARMFFERPRLGRQKGVPGQRFPTAHVPRQRRLHRPHIESVAGERCAALAARMRMHWAHWREISDRQREAPKPPSDAGTHSHRERRLPGRLACVFVSSSHLRGVFPASVGQLRPIWTGIGADLGTIGRSVAKHSAISANVGQIVSTSAENWRFAPASLQAAINFQVAQTRARCIRTRPKFGGADRPSILRDPQLKNSSLMHSQRCSEMSFLVVSTLIATSTWGWPNVVRVRQTAVKLGLTLAEIGPV